MLAGGRKLQGILGGDAAPQIFIPMLIDYYRQGRLPFDRLIRFYPFAQIADAFRDMEHGETIKPVLRMEILIRMSSSEARRTLPVRNPRTGEVDFHITPPTTEELASLCAKLRKAQRALGTAAAFRTHRRDERVGECHPEESRRDRRKRTARIPAIRTPRAPARTSSR